MAPFSLLMCTLYAKLAQRKLRLPESGAELSQAPRYELSNILFRQFDALLQQLLHALV